jgi:molybdate transport system substrate-binding protein
MSPPAVSRFPVLAAVATVLILAACGSGSSRDGGLLVLAAASLTDAFMDMERAFESANPDIDVEVAFGASSTLREQILEGAPAGVFASADLENMAAVADAGLASGPRVFARNELAIAVPAGNPAAVRGLEDFARHDLVLGLCAAQVPCGRYARRVLAAAGIDAAPDTDEPTVRSLLTKIEAGEVDAGLVYRTDVAAAVVDGIEIPSSRDDAAEYAIAVLEGAPEAAAAFVAFVLSSEGVGILTARGFVAP